MESIQYSAALAVTDAIRGTSTKKPYQKLSLGSLCKRRWCFFKIFKGQFPEYVFRILLTSISRAYNIRTSNNISLFSGKHNFFRIFFLSPVI